VKATENITIARRSRQKISARVDKIHEPKFNDSEIPVRPERKRKNEAFSNKRQEGKLGCSSSEERHINRPSTKISHGHVLNKHVGMVMSNEILSQEKLLESKPMINFVKGLYLEFTPIIANILLMA
jgi:hypothetical protein